MLLLLLVSMLTLAFNIQPIKTEPAFMHATREGYLIIDETPRFIIGGDVYMQIENIPTLTLAKVSGKLQILEPSNGWAIAGICKITFAFYNTGDDVEFFQSDSANRIDLEIEWMMNSTHGWGIPFWSTASYGLKLRSGENFTLTVFFDPSGWEESVPSWFVGDSPYGETVVRLVHWKKIDEDTFAYGEFGVTEIKVSLQKTTHEGDLLIDGNQTFLIENCTYIQTGNIYVKENASFVIEKAELVMNMSESWQYNIYIYDTGKLFVKNGNISTSTMFDIDLYDKTVAHIADSKIGGKWGELGYVVIEATGGSSANISIKNSEVYYVRAWSDSSNILVSNSSDVTAFSVKWLHSSLSVIKLRSGFISHWNSYKNTSIVGQCPNITIFDSSVGWSEMFFDETNALVKDSEINSLWCLTDSNVTITNTTGAWIHSLDASEVNVYNITRHQYLAPWGGKTKISLFNLRLYRLWAENFQGTIFSENVVIETVLFRDSQFYIWGNFSYVGGVHEWTDSNVTRNFNVMVMNETGHPLADAELTLFDQNNGVVWSGFSSSRGKANFNHTFLDSNYTDTLRLEAVKGASFSAKNVTFLSETPIMMVLLSPPAGMSADLVRRKAWPEHHRYLMSKDEDEYQSLYGLVKNSGNVTIPAEQYKVVWTLTTSRGVTSYETTGTVDLAPKEITTLTYSIPASELSISKYYVEAKCYYYGMAGETTKTFTFKVSE